MALSFLNAAKWTYKPVPSDFFDLLHLSQMPCIQ